MRCGVYVRVSTDDQRDNDYSIDSQLRMIKEYCEKNNYDIVDVYNDAGHSGKDLMRPEMQRLLKDIKSHKIEVIVAIKVIRNWMSNKNFFDFYNLWEELHNENFNSVESHRIKIDEVGYNRFTMTPNRWKKDFNAIGIIPSSGKYSIGTFAHQILHLNLLVG